MTWAASLSALIGAVIALASTLLVDGRRDRQQRGRDRQSDRRRHCIDFTVALSEAFGGLRIAARQPGDPADRYAAAREAVAGVYASREQLLVSGTPKQLVEAEAAFHRLIDVRDAVRGGAGLDSAAFHDAYHAFSEALWRFRLTVRADAGEPNLTPAALDRPDWTDRDRCDTCRALTAQGQP